MQQHFRRIGLAAAFALGMTLPVTAATVTVIDHSTQGIGNDADVYAAGYGANTPIGATWSVDPTRSAGNAPTVAQSPFNNTPDLGTQDYFSVGGGTVLGPVTLTFGEMQTAFQLLWGSIDSYNTIAFFDGVTEVFSFTGTQLVNKFTSGLTGRNYELVALVNFDFGQEGFTSVRFASSTPAFEFGLAPIPLPAGGVLLLTALGGLAVLRRRKEA